ncbi:MAG TPA: ScpA family protein [Acidimicrobiia bacterium]|nr:ScpA family protein [Acidimicrobiia bacterium]
MSYDIRTPVFEGPLDLLLQLITARRLDVTEVSLTEIVTEYLAFLQLAEDLDLEITSEFLVIASTLIQLKARRLLPGDADVDLDEELALLEERDRLLSRLLACLTFRDVAAVIAHRLETTGDLIPRLAGLDDDIRPLPPELHLETTVRELVGIAAGVIGRRREPDLDHLDLDLPSVTAAIGDIRERVRVELEIDFDRLTDHLGRSVEVVAYFLAVLELARWGMIEASQNDFASPIVLRHRAEAAALDVVSEWHG